MDDILIQNELKIFSEFNEVYSVIKLTNEK